MDPSPLKRLRTDPPSMPAITPSSDANMAAEQLQTSQYMPWFEVFRAELDAHHDRRERIIKASRDITANSKKM